jgi:hypothetical protein
VADDIVLAKAERMLESNDFPKGKTIAFGEMPESVSVES